jgi:SAM-dependent methyltransferase
MLLPQIKGLKFPDEFLVRAFFKSGLFGTPGRVIEFGCENGNNLSVFFQYGWSVKGVDIVGESIEDAKQNFETLSKAEHLEQGYEFVRMDMLEYPDDDETKWDAILFPSSLYYVPLDSFRKMLSKLPSLISDSGTFCYFRMRRPNDGRTRISSPLPDGKTRRIEGETTGEKGLSMTFWEPDEFLSELSMHCRVEKPVVLGCEFENLQCGQIVANSDFILWGQLFNR